MLDSGSVVPLGGTELASGVVVDWVVVDGDVVGIWVVVLVVGGASDVVVDVVGGSVLGLVVVGGSVLVVVTVVGALVVVVDTVGAWVGASVLVVVNGLNGKHSHQGKLATGRPVRGSMGTTGIPSGPQAGLVGLFPDAAAVVVDGLVVVVGFSVVLLGGWPASGSLCLGQHTPYT